MRERRWCDALRRLSDRIDALDSNRWEMSLAEHVAFMRQTSAIVRHQSRLRKVGRQWGMI